MRRNSCLAPARFLVPMALLLACTSVYGQRRYRSGAASDHYGSRRGLPQNRGGAEVNRYLTGPYTYDYPPRGYPRQSAATVPPYGYGNPYPYDSPYYYDISPYVSASALRPSTVIPSRSAALETPARDGTPIPPSNADIDSGNSLSQAVLIPASPAASNYQHRAEQAFREHKFEDAERLASHAVLEDSKNGKLLLFAAQTELAVGDYEGAAALIHQATSFLPPQEWGFVVRNYQQFYRDEDFVLHMKRLEAFINSHANLPAAQFLCGYEYMYLGHGVAARKHLQAAVTLEPQDTLAEELLHMLPAIDTRQPHNATPHAEVLPPPEPIPISGLPSAIDPPRPLTGQERPTVP